MNDFVYHNTTKMYFGKQVESKIGDEIKALGYKVIMIVYGQNSIIKNGLLGRVHDSLKKAGLSFVDYGGVVANPSKSHMLDGVQFARTNVVDFVLAVGGGSVIDEAKGIAAGAVNDDIWEYYSRKKTGLTKALPLGAVLTLPATGSENNINSVVRDQDTGIKYGLSERCMLPVLTFVNPEVCFSLPKVQIANGASDMMAHLMEVYMSPQDNVVTSDHLLTGAMQAVMDIAPKLYGDNGNYQLWAEFCNLGTLALNGMLSMGRKGDWATHGLETRYLSGINNIAHGTGLAIVFVAWLKKMSTKRPTKVLQFCKHAMLGQGNTDSQIIQDGIANLIKFYKSLDLPVSLGEIGIQADTIKSMIAKDFDKNSKVGGYAQLDIDDISDIFELAR